MAKLPADVLRGFYEERGGDVDNKGEMGKNTPQATKDTFRRSWEIGCTRSRRWTIGQLQQIIFSEKGYISKHGD